MLKLPISAVKLNDENPRTLKDVRFQQLIKSIQDFPQMLDLRPCVVDENHVVLGGNMRLRAMQHLGFTEVAVTVAKGLTEAQKKEFVIKDNGSFGEWDFDALANGDWPDAATLHEWGMEIPADWGVVELPAAEEGEPDLTPPREPITVLGDLYELNGHRLHCADSTDSDAVAKLMDGKKAKMVYTDPPYGIAYDNTERWEGIEKQTGSAKRNAGEMIMGDDADFDPSFLLQEFGYCKEVFVWGMQYYPDKLGPGGVIVWNRKTKEQADVPHADFELCWSKQPRNKMAWIMWGGFHSKEKGEARLHTTQKPIELALWFFENWGKGADLVVDAFLGSGSTLMACEQTNRTCYGQELDPKYADVIVRRWLRYMADNNRPATVKRNGTVLTPAELADFTPKQC